MRDAGGARKWVSAFWKPTRPGGMRDNDLYLIAECIDIACDRYHQAGGMPALEWGLANDDALEHALSRFGAEQSYQLTGDRRAWRDQQTCHMPGQGELMPEWKCESSRQQAKALFQQEGRLRRHDYKDSSDEEAGGGRRRRKKKKKKKEDAAAKGGGAS